MGIGAAIAVTWFCWLVPILNRFDPRWGDRFTKLGYWAQVQHDIRRYGWMHNDFDDVGKYGDSTWAEWIVAQAEQGRGISDCGHGHKDSALQYLTCQNPAKDTAEGRTEEAIGKAWVEWWMANNDKTQEHWIRDGLARYGVLLHVPPSSADFGPLLTVLGDTATNRLERVPHYVKYNAFRWLRDSGFDPLRYALSNVSPETPEAVKNGLFAYCTNATLYPKIDGVGILAFGKQTSAEDTFPGPYLLTYPARLTAYSLMVFPICLGSYLLVVSRRLTGNLAPKTRADAEHQVEEHEVN